MAQTVCRRLSTVLLAACLLLATGATAAPRVILTATPKTTAAEFDKNLSSAKPTIEKLPANVRLFRLINNARSRAADYFFSVYYWLGNGYVIVPIMLLVIWWRRRKVPVLLLSLLLETLVINLLKHYFYQARPALVLDHVYLLQIPGVDTPFFKSFPSGDVALAFAIATPLAWGERWWVQALFYLYGALIAYERIYVGVHFPLDVTTGALIGILCGMLAIVALRAWFRWRPEPEAEPASAE